MPEVPSPPKVALDATTDQGLAEMRDAWGALARSGPGGELTMLVVEGFAAPLREQFPGVPVGRVIMSAVQSLTALKRNCGDLGFGDADALLSVAGLAAGRLDRGEAGRG